MLISSTNIIPSLHHYLLSKNFSVETNILQGYLSIYFDRVIQEFEENCSFYLLSDSENLCLGTPICFDNFLIMLFKAYVLFI